MKKSLLFALLVLLSTVFALPAFAAQPLVKMPTAWMDEYAGFNIWYAKKMGWDKEEGLDIEMLLFSTGPAQMEALPSKTWVLGSTGIGGQLVGGIRHKIYIVAPSKSEGLMHDMFLRPGHPATKVKGWNPKFPDVYGSPETVKGMTILYTAQTTTHYMAGKWLEIFGLTPNDVKMVNMDATSIVPAFEKGVGDAAFLWAPLTFAAEARGWPSGGTMEQIGSPTVSALVGDRDWCDANPELVAKFLRIWFRTNNMVVAEGPSDRIVAEYRQFMNDFSGIKLTPEEAKKDIQVNPCWTYEEVMKLVDTSNGMSQAERWQLDVADFFVSIGRFTPQEIEKFKAAKVNTDKFLKMVQLPIPDWRK